MKQQTPIEIVKELITTLSDFKGFEVLPTDNGVSTDVYKLTKGSETFYLRLSDPGENMSTEVLAHQLILEKGVKAPAVAAYEDFNELLNRSYMITTEIKGISAKTAKTNQINIAFEAGKDIAKVNSIKVSGFGWLDWKTPNISELKGEYTSWEAFALDFNRIEAMLKDLREAGTVDSVITDKYLNYVDDNKHLISCTQACLSHGDLGLDHIYVYKGMYSGIIDFGDIRATSIYHDLAHFYTYSPEGFEDLLRGYLDITQLGDGHREKIEFIAMLFVVGKLWWVTKNLPGTLDRRKNDFRLLSRVLELD